MRQIETFVEDKRSLDSAISEEEGVGQLRQRVAVFCHIRGFSMFSGRGSRLTRRSSATAGESELRCEFYCWSHVKATHQNGQRLAGAIGWARYVYCHERNKSSKL